MTTSSRIEDRFIAVWEASQGHALNGTSETLHRARRKGIEHFAGSGFPLLRTEAWKYTNIRRLVEAAPAFEGPAVPSPLAQSQIEPHLIADLDAHTVVLVDGVFNRELSQLGELQAGLTVESLTEASAQHTELFDAYFDRYPAQTADGFVSLNTAFARDGLFVHVAEDVALERPIVIYHFSTGQQEAFLQPRMLFALAPGAKASIVEVRRAIGQERAFVNAVTECYTGVGANFDHLCLIDLPSNAVLVNTLRSYQARESHFSTNTFTLGGDTVRNQQQFLPDGEDCETHLAGFYLGRGGAHIDNHTLVDHAQPNCYSNELFKGILDDAAVGVFNGKVLVRQDAQKTNAYQSNKAILLSEDAQIFAKPELEIYADDVKCSHGATTGELDEDALFYLRSRGIPLKAARQMLLLAFARDVMERIKLPAVREHIDALVADRLAN